MSDILSKEKREEIRAGLAKLAGLLPLKADEVAMVIYTKLYTPEAQYVATVSDESLCRFYLNAPLDIPDLLAHADAMDEKASELKKWLDDALIRNAEEQDEHSAERAKLAKRVAELKAEVTTWKQVAQDAADMRAESDRVRTWMIEHVRAKHNKWQDDTRALSPTATVRETIAKTALCVAAEEILAALEADDSLDTCEWVMDTDGVWETTCNNAFVFSDGPPSANHIKFCGYCGRVLVEKQDEEPADDLATQE